MKRTFVAFLLATLPLAAQAPRAEVVDPTLEGDPGNDFFVRGKNVHDTAKKTEDPAARKALFQRAAQILGDYLREFPNHPNADAARWYLGQSFTETGRADEARQVYRTLADREKTSLWTAAAAHELAAEHYKKQEYAQAAPLFARYAAGAAKAEEQARGHFLAADAYRRAGEREKAAAAYRAVVASPAGARWAPQSRLALGHLTAEAGDLAAALEHFQKVIATDLDARFRGEAALQAGLIALKLGKPEVARENFRLILESEGMEKFRPEAQLALMAELYAEKKYREVVEAFRASGGSSEGTTEARRLMLAAESYFRLDQPKEARPLFAKAESLVPPKHDLAFRAAYYQLLCAFRIDKKHATEQLDRFLKTYRPLHPDDARTQTVMTMKAESLLAAGKTAEAAELFSAIDPAKIGEENRANLRFNRAWALAESGKHAAAVEALGEFLKHHPQDDRRPQALAKRAQAYQQLEQPGRALADLDQLTKADVSADLARYAWAESARIQRARGEIADMVSRYRQLLEKSGKLPDELRAEANFFTGWGLARSEAGSEAAPYLESARELDPKTYGKQAGRLLVAIHAEAKDRQKLIAEIERAIQSGYGREVPAAAAQWAGAQAFESGDFATAARLLELAANADEPEKTPEAVWRLLAKSRLETGDFAGVLPAVANVLAVEDDPGWRADAFHDRGRALFELERFAEARKAADEGLALRPPPRTNAELLILSADLKMRSGDVSEAAADYLRVGTFGSDEDIVPLALWKAEQALEEIGDQKKAETAREERAKKFPDWSPPAR